MRCNQLHLLAVIVIAALTGCVPFWPEVPEASEDTFLAIDMTGFGSPEALPVTVNGVTAEAKEVTLPAELVQSAPADLTMTLSLPQIDPTLDAGHVNPLSKDGAFNATITFHLAAPGEDACSSPLSVGPYNVSMSNGQVQIEKSAIPLPAEAADLVRSGRFEICAETSADFDGALSVSELIVEFGRLNPGDVKVEICHVPPGDPDVRHTITIASSALETHLAKGSYLGACLEVVQPLQLTSVCSDNPDLSRRWKVQNPNGSAVDATWEVYGTSQTGAITATPGDSYFETQTVAGPNTVVLRWMDENGVERSTAKASGGAQCVTPPSETADADGDGVADAADSCPGTPVDELVDMVGCSCSQLDEDSDGVNDCDDFCPGTPAGSPIDASGCEIIVADAGADVVLYEVGPLTLHAAAVGGTAPYTYTWSAPGWAGSSEQNPTVMPGQTTEYTLTVVDWSFPPQIATDTVTVTIAPRAGLQYSIVSVGSLSSKNSYANGLNDLGQVVGYYYTDTWIKRAFLFSEGVMTDIGTLGGTEAYASAVNNLGQVVGQSRTATGAWHAFLWDATNGMRDLGTLGGNASEAYAINNSGQVAGFSATATGNQAFLYSSGAMTQVAGTNAYAQSGAFDINDSGNMAGILLTSGGASVAFEYAGGLVNLGSPMLTGSEAWLINNSGVVAGHSWGGSQYRSFLYANGVAVDLGLLTGFERTYAWGLSDNGQVVGSVTNATTGLSHAFVYTGGKLVDLNSLLAPNSGWEYLSSATVINANGQIAGYGKIGGLFRGCLLTPNQ